MGYVRTRSGLGFAPVAAFGIVKTGFSALKSIFGTKPPEKTLPWRFSTPPGTPPGYFHIVYMGSKYDKGGFRDYSGGPELHSVWEGWLDELYSPQGFDIGGGPVDGGRRNWRVFVKDRVVHMMEDFGKGWIESRAFPEREIMSIVAKVEAREKTGPYVPKTQQAAQAAQVAQVTPYVQTAPVVSTASMVSGGASGYLPLLIVAGLTLMFIVRK